jgi:phosphatidylglycerophosphatase A
LNFAFWIATLGYAGLSKRAPGTIGSMVSLFLWAPLLFWGTPWGIRIISTFLLFCLGLWAIKKSSSQFKGNDPQSIVIDEAVGMGITLSLCLPTWWNLLLAFALFRFFDVLKPWPVSWADRKIKGSLGIMLDDIFAGIYALIVLSIWEHYYEKYFSNTF